MKVVKGNFLKGLEAPHALVAAPTNGVLTSQGLVMGAGAARALAEVNPQLPILFAEAIRRKGVYRDGVYLYGFVAVEVDGRPYGAFQSKGHFRGRADLALIRLAASRLQEFLEEHPGLEVHLAFPGIGLGKLKPEKVLEVLEKALGPVKDRILLYRL